MVSETKAWTLDVKTPVQGLIFPPRSSWPHGNPGGPGGSQPEPSKGGSKYVKIQVLRAVDLRTSCASSRCRVSDWQCAMGPFNEVVEADPFNRVHGKG